MHPLLYPGIIHNTCEMQVPMPGTLSFNQAASCPTVFITTTLVTKAIHIGRGNKVLLHGAAGGVGLAALQQIQAIHAVPVGTAGSPEKRSLLRLRGVQQAVSSRDLKVVTELASTGGVDAVLNTLTSPGMLAGSVAGLKVGGRLVEISKRDIWSPARLAQDRPDVHYSLLALDFLPQQAIHSCMLELSASLAGGKLQPLPVVVHSMTNVQTALRLMSRARHIGKVVVEMPSPDGTSGNPGSMAITGGTGALGSAVAQWLIEDHRHVSLLGRSGKATTNTVQLIKSKGQAQITLSKCDVSSAADVQQLEHGGTALAGVVHAGGVLDDASLAKQTPKHCRAVFAPKVDAVLNLQGVTAQLPLKSFVAFSSMAAVLGSPGQANYSAANAFLDSTCAEMRLQGLAANAVQFGAWRGAGMAGNTADKLRAMGIGALTPDQGIRALQGFLGSAQNSPALVPASMAAAAFDWPVLLSSLDQPSALFAEFAHEAKLARPLPQKRTTTKPVPQIATRPQLASSAQTQLSAVNIDELRAEIIAAAQDIVGNTVSASQPLMTAGLDSLSSVELTNALQRKLGVQLPSTLVFDYPTVDAIVEFVSTQLQPSAAADSATLHSGLSSVLTTPSNGTGAGIAITAITGRMPEPLSRSTVTQGVIVDSPDCSRVIPADRWSADLQLTQDMAARFGMFLNQPFSFDAEAFATSHSEAIVLDPQQRLLLESTHEVFSQHQGRADVPLAPSRSPVGVFVGISTPDYADLGKAHSGIGVYTATGSALSVAAGRLSYFFGFSGPSVSGGYFQIMYLHISCVKSNTHGDAGCHTINTIQQLLPVLVSVYVVCFEFAPAPGPGRQAGRAWHLVLF